MDTVWERGEPGGEVGKADTWKVRLKRLHE